MKTPIFAQLGPTFVTQNFTLIFLLFFTLTLAVRLWLKIRHIRFVSAHRASLPAGFADTVTLPTHQKAADYTVDRSKAAVAGIFVDAGLLLALTLGGGLAGLHEFWMPRADGLLYGLAMIFSLMLISGLVDLPLSLYSQFVVEARHGFNRMTPGLFFADLVKQTLLGALIGAPVILAVLWLMGAMGENWWLYVWLFWSAFNLLLMFVYPTWIAPLFNKFSPLPDVSLAERVSTLMARCGFRAKGLFVMDGSKRSAHSNAYFTGLGAAKRVVFFDTLLQRLSPGEVEAVLAHELGHFKLKHVPKRMLAIFGASLAALALLGWLAQQQWFYSGLGVTPNLPGTPNDVLALMLLMFALPPFGFLVTPVAAALSRKHEFEADAYACAQASGRDLAQALVKLHEDNAGTLTPDPLYARFYYSHPPAAERLAALKLEAQA